MLQKCAGLLIGHASAVDTYLIKIPNCSVIYVVSNIILILYFISEQNITRIESRRPYFCYFKNHLCFLLTRLHLLNYAGINVTALNQEGSKSVHSTGSSALSTDATSKETRQTREKVT